MNQAQIIGNLTANPEIRETPNGHKVASFSIATNRKWKDNTWIKQEDVEYHNIIAWNKLAEIIEEYCNKGKKVFIQWRLQTRSWEDTNGIKRYKTEIIAEQLEMLGGWNKKEQDDGWIHDFPDDESQKEEKAKAATKRKVPQEEISIEDIPF